MKTDLDLQRDLMAELQFEPAVDPADIGVAVNAGVVTLSGRVKSYAEKWLVVRTTERISGVKAVVDKLEVNVPSTFHRTDQDIARAIAQTLQWDVIVPEDRIKVHVENGWVILKGSVDYKYQQEAVENAIRNLAGVTGITNHVKFTPPAAPHQVKEQIEDAIRRAATRDARRIQVEVKEHKVTLRGEVLTWAERSAAERAAWSAPGVWEVEDDLVIA